MHRPAAGLPVRAAAAIRAQQKGQEARGTQQHFASLLWFLQDVHGQVSFFLDQEFDACAFHLLTIPLTLVRCNSFASNFTGGTAQAASTSDERLSSKQIGRLGDKRGTAHAGRTRLSRTSSGASAESASRVAKNRTDENRVGGVDEQGATAEVFGDEPGIEFPPSLSESAEGLVVAGIYRIIVFRYSNPPMPSRERAFFELLHQLAMEATTSTFPLALRPAIAREMARICRSDFFNSTRRVDEEREDSEVSRVRAKDLYALRNLGRSGGKDSRIINAMNVKRKSLHPHISVTRQEALEARSRMVAAVVPAPMERLKHSLDLIKAEATLSRSCLDVHTDGGGGGGDGERRHAMTRPPFDVSTKGQGSAGGLGLRAASAAAGGGHTTWTCHQTLSPDRTRIHRLVESNGRRFLQQMYTREIRRATYSGDHKHWARSLTAKQAVGGQDAADASTGASDLQQQPDASQAQPDPVAPRVPHYLVGSETEILRQAIDDHRTALMVADNDKQKHLIASLHAAHAAAKLLRKTERAKKRAREENLKKKMSTMQEREAAMRATLSDSNRL